MPDEAVFPSQHVWCAQPGQVPKAANLPLLKATLCFLLVFLLFPPFSLFLPFLFRTSLNMLILFEHAHLSVFEEIQRKYNYCNNSGVFQVEP